MGTSTGQEQEWYKFVNTSSQGWTLEFPFNDSGEYPFYIEVEGCTVDGWTFWEGSKITGNLPPSPIDIDSSICEGGESVSLRLTLFGSTNLRISVFPWFD